MQTGDRTVYKVAQKREDCLGMRARNGAPRCTYAPEEGGRKACPVFSQKTGTYFPCGALDKRKGPLCRGPSQFKVAGKGIAPALRACGPLRRFAPCELRWQTLSRLLSSAPSRGSIPCGGHVKEKDPFAEVLVNSRWRGRESNP